MDVDRPHRGLEEIGPGMSAADAVERMMEAHGGMLFSLGLRFCGNPDDAADLVQETLLQAFRDWASFRGDARPATWLYRIAARTCQRMHRQRATAALPGTVELLAGAETTVPSVPRDMDDPAERVIVNEARERLEVAIAALPDDYRMPLVLKEIVGFSGPEVGKILGLPPATVRVRVHRARLALRQAIEAGLPRRPSDTAPGRSYRDQVCLDLIEAKQDAIDRGVPFDLPPIELPDRWRSILDSLDLAHELCVEIEVTDLPARVLRRVRGELGVNRN